MKEPTNSVLNTDSYDRRRFAQLMEMSEKLKAVEKEGNELFPSFQPLMGDLWAGLFKMKPELLEDVSDEMEMNRQLMEKVMADDGYTDFREFTRLDDLAAALGTTKYSETVLGWVKEQTKQDQDLAEALQQLMDGEQGASQQAADALSTALTQNGKSLSRMLSRAAQEAVEAKENVKSLLGGIQAGSGDGEMKKVPLKDQLFLAEKLSTDRRLREIAAWAGRMKVIANRSNVRSIRMQSVETGFGKEMILSNCCQWSLEVTQALLAKWISYADMRKVKLFSMIRRDMSSLGKGRLFFAWTNQEV